MPLAQQVTGAFEVVIGDQSSAATLHLLPDVDLVGDERGHTAGQCLRDDDAEVLLMRGQHKDLRGVDGSPLHVATNHARPGEAIADAELFGQLLQTGLQAHLIRSAEQEVPVGIEGELAGEGLDEQIAAFLFVNAAEEERDAFTAQMRILGEELFSHALSFYVWCADAEADDNLIGAVVRKGLAGEQALLLTGEEHGASITQHAVFRPRPVERFLQVLERVCLLEPGIEHAVRVNDIGQRAAVQSAPGSKAVVLPQAVDDGHIKALEIGAQPGYKLRIVVVAEMASADGVHGEREVLDERVGRIVEAEDFDILPESVVGGGQLENALDGAAAQRVDARDDVQDSHLSERPCQGGGAEPHHFATRAAPRAAE